MDSSLRSDKHVDNITKKAATICRMILSTFTARSQVILKRTFYTYVRTILDYCSPIRNPNKNSYRQDWTYPEIYQGLRTLRGFSSAYGVSDYLTYQLSKSVDFGLTYHFV